MALKVAYSALRLQLQRISVVGFSTKAATAATTTQVDRRKSKPKMRFVQFYRKRDNRKRLGVVSEDGRALVELSGGPCISNDMISFIKQKISVNELETKLANLKSEPIDDTYVLLPPISNPGKIICIGLNYKCHCDEQNKPTPEEPIFFSKYPTTIVGPLSDVIAHKITNKIDWECELAVVIGQEARQVSKASAMDYVFGYAVAQDITARDWQRRNGGQFLLGKSMDTFCPLGPSVVHKSLICDVNNLYMKTFVNGQLKQDGNTGSMIFKIDDVIHRLSQFMTLLPGDIILTGTPKGVGAYQTPRQFLKPGDTVETEIQCLGKLLNKVVAPKP